MLAIVLAFVSGTAQHNRRPCEPDRSYCVKPLISSMTNVLRLTSTVSPFFMNREGHENRESFDDANRSALPQLTMNRPLIASSLHYKKRNLGLEIEGQKNGRLGAHGSIFLPTIFLPFQISCRHLDRRQYALQC